MGVPSGDLRKISDMSTEIRKNVVVMQKEAVKHSEAIKQLLLEMNERGNSGHEYAKQTLAYVYADLGLTAADLRQTEKRLEGSPRSSELSTTDNQTSYTLV